MTNYVKALAFLYLLTDVLGSKKSPEAISKLNSKSRQEDENSVMNCKCGKSLKIVKKKIDMNLAEEIFRLESYSTLNRSRTPEYNSEILHMLKKCSSCKISYTKCFGDQNDFDVYFCYKNAAYIGGSDRVLSVRYNGTDFSKTVRLTNKTLTTYPEEIDVPQGDWIDHHHHHHHRQRRQLLSCAYPTSLQTSSLKCKIYPSSVKCLQKCAVGYTLRNGTDVMRVCKKNDNVWKPGSFEECQPYIDCSLTLVSGGSKNCSTPTTTKNVKCDVKCEEYEDKLEEEERTYSCDVDGKWSPHLPFCVQAGSGLDLARRPHKSHKKETDHYYYYVEDF